MLPLDLDKVEVDGVEEQRQGFKEHQTGHQVVNLKHWMATLAQYEHPEDAGEQEQDGHHEVQGGQRHLTGRQIISVVILLNVHVKVERHRRVVVVVGAAVKIQVVEALLLFGANKYDKLYREIIER